MLVAVSRVEIFPCQLFERNRLHLCGTVLPHSTRVDSLLQHVGEHAVNMIPHEHVGLQNIGRPSSDEKSARSFNNNLSLIPPKQPSTALGYISILSGGGPAISYTYGQLPTHPETLGHPNEYVSYPSASRLHHHLSINVVSRTPQIRLCCGATS